MAEEYWLGKAPYPGVNFRTCVPWACGLEHEANRQFKQVFEERKQKANVFSVLGWEAALLIAAFAASEDTETGISILEGHEFDSPRGKIVINAVSHQVEAPVYEALIAKDEATGNCLLVAGEAVAFVDEQRERTEEDVRSFTGHSTSWLNTYPCLDS
jgi:branched-chain amino acid transport system substrate-binding protein